MTPQQNSTLIDDNLDGCLSLINLPDELNRYSPILPPNLHQIKTPVVEEVTSEQEEGAQEKRKGTKMKENQDRKPMLKNVNTNNNNKNNNSKYKVHESKFFEQYNHAKRNAIEQRECKYSKHCRHSGRSSHNGYVGHRSRSISLHGINSTVEQGHKEIPIWLGAETRYVSGVTNKTTCNDIIKALIDDEFHNAANNMDNGNNYAYYMSTQCKDGVPASRDYSDYVITECWRGIERSYDGNMAILPVWKAWSRVHNELRLSLKHRKNIREPALQNPIVQKQAEKKRKIFSTLRQYLTKCLQFTKRKRKLEKIKMDELLLSSAEKNIEIPDELLFIILPDKLYTNNNDDDNNDNADDEMKLNKNQNIKPTMEESTKLSQSKVLKARLYKLSEDRRSIRSKKRYKTNNYKTKDCNKKQQRNNNTISDTSSSSSCIRRLRTGTGHRHHRRSSIRQRLAQKTNEVDALFEREHLLQTELSEKCKLHRLQNELYTNPEKQLEISVGQLQCNIEEYAKQIIQTEHELLELKNEIKQDISLINNLKRMSIATDAANEYIAKLPVLMEKQDGDHRVEQTAHQMEKRIEGNHHMEFVDNIYEFCDNNASMLV